jgi:hypothetical protein
LWQQFSIMDMEVGHIGAEEGADLMVTVIIAAVN